MRVLTEPRNMEQPTIKTTLHDPTRSIDFHVIAYRPLARAELIATVRAFMAQKRRPKLKRGQSITIVTIIGFDE